MPKVIINAKGSAELREALRVAAFNSKPRITASAYLINLLEQDPAIAKELKALEKKKPK